jgi:hypothetical protein
MKLYEVRLKGLQTAIHPSPIRGQSYVIASNPEEAYQKVREYLDEKKLGDYEDREMDSITLIAEVGDFPNCKIQLFI